MNSLHIDKTKVTEGEIVELLWDCTGAEQTRLTIDNGHRSDSQQVECNGTKKFRLNRTGKTIFTLTETRNGKAKNHIVKVRVKELKAVRAETIDDRGKPFPRWKQKLQQWRNTWKYQSRSLPPEKRFAYKLFFIIGGITLFITFFPKLFVFGQLVIMGYLLWVIFRR